MTKATERMVYTAARERDELCIFLRHVKGFSSRARVTVAIGFAHPASTRLTAKRAKYTVNVAACRSVSLR